VLRHRRIQLACCATSKKCALRTHFRREAPSTLIGGASDSLP
jgi:hypothetical protein